MQKQKKIRILLIIFITILMAFCIGGALYKENKNKQIKMSNENRRAINYEQLENNQKIVEGTDGHVEFSAFFLRDLDGNGYAEPILGTCKEIGDKDTLYMEVNVKTKGYLKSGEIKIDGKNFYFSTVIPKDSIVSENYIGNNTKEIKLNQINNGTQKILMGVVTSGDYTYESQKISAIGNDIDNYSRDDNKIVLRGVYVDDTGHEEEIIKEVDLTVDWYGKTKADIYKNINQKHDIKKAIDEKNSKFCMNFSIYTFETENQLNLKKSILKGLIPELNGYAPVNVNVSGSDVTFTYNEETREFTAEKNAVLNEENKIIKNAYDNYYNNKKRQTKFDLEVSYPLEAYRSIGADTVEVKIPIQAQYEGFNNANEEFINPYISNIARETIVLNYQKIETQGEIVTPSRFEITVGKRIYSPNERWIVRKNKPLRIYNELSSEEKDDTYIVCWYGYQGKNESSSSMVMKESADENRIVSDEFIKSDSSTETMSNVTTNIGIYFSNPVNMLGEDGWIKVYNDETNDLLETFTNKNWSKYSSSNPYKYNVPVKHIRVETSKTNSDSSICVYNIKELDDEYITTNYTLEEFDNLSYIKSTLFGCLIGGSVSGDFTNTVTNQAHYEAPLSIATISVSKKDLSTQETEKNEIITINADKDDNNNIAGWTNGTFLVKLPKEIVAVDINDVSISNNNVKICSCEVLERDKNEFIKINTSNNNSEEYSINIDVKITPNPTETSDSADIELYAVNEECQNYYRNAEDIYDVDSNLNITQQVNYSKTSLKLIAPNTLLTSQVAKNYDDKGSITIAPQIAEITKDNRKATIEFSVVNDYVNTISEVKILGKIPFENNSFILNGGNLGSTFSTTMSNTGIIVPENLQGKVTVYYSEKEDATKDLTEENSWKKKEAVSDWSKIKTFLIDYENYILQKGEKNTFTYEINIPTGIDYNKVAYSTHAIYFNLDTEEGKYRTQTEPNKLGFRIAKKIDLELTKYQKGTEFVVPMATYSISEVHSDGTEELIKTETTGNDGKLLFDNLYIDIKYAVREIKTPKEYELNEEVVKFTTSENDENDLIATVEEGALKTDLEVRKIEEKNTILMQVEDKVRPSIKLIKTEEGLDTRVPLAKYKLIGKGFEKGRVITTNNNGEAILKGLYFDQEYTLEETKAEGYYLGEKIKFKIENNEGVYSINQTEGTIKNYTVDTTSNIPVISIELEDKKIPRYNLQIEKIKKVTTVQTGTNEGLNEGNSQEIEHLVGAKFKLYKGEKEIGEYITDENGIITIENLYQYETEKDIDQTYTLKEVLPPEGYVKVKDIKFKVENVQGELKFLEDVIEGQSAKRYTVEGTTVKVVVEDSPTFKLIKKDAETGELLANVKFALYNVDEGQVLARNSKGEIIGTKETINGKEYYVVQTDANGELTADLPEGFYKAVEVEAPEKYDISDNVYYFGIGVSREGKKGLKATWAESVGGDNSVYINSVCETSDGGKVVVGEYVGTIDLGDAGIFVNNSMYSNVYNGIIIKYTPEGTIDWARNIGGNMSDGLKSVCETSNNEILVGGYFGGEIVLEDENKLTSNGSIDGMIVKYSEDGTILGSKNIGGNKSDYITSICETVDAGIALGGYFSSDIIEFENGNSIRKNGNDYNNDDGMIIKYKDIFTDNEEVLWAKSVGGSNNEAINSICAIQDGGVVVGGYFNSSSIDLENEIKLKKDESTVYSNGMIIKYLENGNVDWARSIGGKKEDIINSVCENKDGDIVAGGYFKSSSINLEDKIVSNNSDYEDGILVKYNSKGDLKWIQNIGGTGQDVIKSVCATQDGGIIVGGYFSSLFLEFGNGIGLINSNYSVNGFILKYNFADENEWANKIGDNRYDYITSICETRNDQILVGGCFESSKIILDNGIELEKKGTTSYLDGMIIKFEKYEVPDLIVKNGKVISGNSDDAISTICETKDGGMVAGGQFLSESIDLENGKVLKNSASGNNIFLIKYNKDEEAEWTKVLEGSISAVLETRDEDLIVLINSPKDKIRLENGIELNNPGVCGGMITKYSKYGEIKWAKLVSGNEYDSFSSLCETQDGGFVVVGRSGSDSLDLGNGLILENNNPNGIVIKYNSEGEAQWAKSIGQESSNELFSVCETKDGGIIVGGYFSGKRLDLGNGFELTNTNEQAYYDNYYGQNGILIKYSKNGTVEKVINIGEKDETNISKICKDPSGGFVVLNRIQNSEGGFILKFDEKDNFEWKNYSDNISDICVTQDGGVLGISEHSLMRYNYKGNLEWKKSFLTMIGSKVLENDNGEIVTAGRFGSYSKDAIYQLDLGNGDRRISNGWCDGMILKWQIANGIQEQSELLVKNKRKEFKITTEVELLDGIKGGAISGEAEKPYEAVKYGDSSTKEIKVTPNHDYEIISVTVNGEDYQFMPDSEDNFTLPLFENIIENKHVVVKFALKENKITINKKDSENSESLANATFRIDQLEERSNPELGSIVASETEYDGPDYENEENITVELTANGNEYTVPDKSNEATGAFGELTNDGEYYFIKEDGKYIPNNLDTNDTIANSYIPIDLTEKTGKYALVLNAETKDDAWGQYLYAIVNDNISTPNYNNSTGRFLYLYRNNNARDYITYLDAGQKYYLHLGYRNQSGNNNEARINSINLYETTNKNFYFIQQGEHYIPNNLDTNDTIANSYIPIDLAGKIGKYALVVNAEIHNDSYDEVLYATMTDNTTAPVYHNNTGRFVYISQNNEAKDYITYLEGDKKYYLHLGYKNISGENDEIKINSIKLYKTKKVKYNFIKNGEQYESNNQGYDNTVANSYIPIDLTDCSGLYDLKINAQISSEYGDYGYATITKTIEIPTYSNSTGRFIYISGTQTAQDYTTKLEGGYTYYLHLGYYKNSSISEGEDKFTVNSISITPNAEHLYHTTVTTNSEGQAITQIPFGKYQITEIRSPEGYWLNEEPTIVEFRSTEGAVHEFTMQDEKKAKVIVHHYLKGTETPIADDVVLSDGKIGEKYTTEPIKDSARYELEKDTNDEFILPENANGTYTYEDINVNYYYVEKKIPLTVHHYLEGTSIPVKLQDGSDAEDVIERGVQGQEYETEALNNVADGFILLEVPENAKGTFEYNEVQVTYYYAEENFDITTKVKVHEETDDLGTVTQVKGGTISGEDENPYENVVYNNSSTKQIKIIPDEGYQIKKITVNTQEIEFEPEEDRTYTLSQFTNVQEDKVIEVEFERINGTVTVHHYIENTITPIQSKTGGEVSDEIKRGNIGSSYATKVSDEAATYYEFVSVAGEASGTYTEEEQVVTYYYKLRNYEYSIEYYYDEVINNDKTETGTAEYGSQITTYEDKNITGYKLQKTENLPLTISETAENNVIKVYYVVDETKTKDLSYTVEYYKDGTKVADDTQTETKTVQVLQPNTIEVDKTKINTVNKYEGYKLDKTDPATIPDTVDSGAVIKVYYVKKDSSIIVHHYFENSTEKIIEDDEITNKKIGDEYTTSPTSNISPNYECINETPDKYEGILSEDLVEVTYYYKLKTPTVSNDVSKIASTDTEKEYKVSDEETTKYFVLTEENGIVTYELKYNIEITDYIGNIDVEIVDTLPAVIKDIDKELDGGDYSLDNKTITWTEHIENINTFECDGGKYQKEITKTIKVRFDNHNLTEDLVNIVNGNVKLYYPDNYPEKAGEKLIESSDEAESKLKQEYTVELNISKVWDDNNNTKEKRPESVTINVKSEDVDFNEDYILNNENEWKCTISNLQKYTETGKLIIYEVSEKETNIGDLEYYEAPEVTAVDNNYTIKNEYKLLKTDLNSEITKDGTEEMKNSDDKIDYIIRLTAEIEDYIGSGKVKIIDLLPYKIDEEKSELNGGKYDEKSLTITWEENLKHINTQNSNKSYKVDIEKEFSLSYKDVDFAQTKITNKVFGKIELFDSDEKDEVESSFDTEINVQGIVKVRFVDKETGKDITYIENQSDEKLYNYEIKDKIGNKYRAEPINIEGYKYLESNKNETGKITEENQEVIFYYAKKEVKVIVKYVDEEGNEIAEEEIIEGQVNDKYETEDKKIDEYELVNVPENYSGEMTNDTITVIYNYKKKEKINPEPKTDTQEPEEKPKDESLQDNQSSKQEENTQPEKQPTTEQDNKKNKKDFPIETVKVFPEESSPIIKPSTEYKPAVYTGDNENIIIYVFILGSSILYLSCVTVVLLKKHLENIKKTK